MLMIHQQWQMGSRGYTYWIYGSLIALGVLIYADNAKAGFFDDAIDAAKGHFTDIKDRILVDEEIKEGDVVATSEFRMHDVGRDAIHWANGSVSIVVKDGVQYIQLGEGFEAGLAPDLYVYVSSDPTRIVDEGTFWSNEGVVELGKIKRSKGASFYEVPEGIDIKSVTIWCKCFGAFIGCLLYTSPSPRD